MATGMVCMLNMAEDEKTQDDMVILITTFTPGFTGLKDITTNNWDVLTRSTKNLSESKIVHEYRYHQK